MPIYNFNEYCGIYSDTLGGLSEFKRDEVSANNNADLTIDNSQLFRYKAALFQKAENVDDGKSFDTKLWYKILIEKLLFH